MTKETIMNTYDIEQGYYDWNDLIEDEDSIIGNLVHIDNVTDLIQEELLKKVTDEITKNKINWIMSWKEIRKEILNTDIL